MKVTINGKPSEEALRNYARLLEKFALEQEQINKNKEKVGKVA